MTNKNINILIAAVAVIIIGLLIWRLPRANQPVVAEPDNQVASTTAPVNEPPISTRPVTAPTTTIIVRAFFGNTKFNPGALDCSKVYALARTIPPTVAVGRAALEELFKGPTAAERAQGFVSAINSGVKIQKLEVKNDIALADFSAELGTGVGGACQVATIRAQITETLKQFPTVKNVTISINGQSQDILQP